MARDKTASSCRGVVEWLRSQALLRAAALHEPLLAALAPMSGVAFILITFHTITDPMTTPTSPRSKFFFCAATALIYGALTVMGVAFGIFFALATTCLLRGILLRIRNPVIPNALAAST